MTELKRNVRWGIIGTANIASKVARAVNLARNADLYAIGSRNQTRAQHWASQHDVHGVYGSYEALLQDRSIDAIYLPTPPSVHAEWAIKAASHGKHILCEKPLALNTVEALAMAEACRKNNVQLMDGVMWTHNERTPQMKCLIDNGDLGTIRRVTTAFTFNWDTIPEDDIRLNKELGGGSLGDLGYYCVGAIIWAFDALPEKVFATARYHAGVDLNLSGLLWFNDARMASFDCGFDTGSRRWLEVAGTKASLVCDDIFMPCTEKSARFWIHVKDGQSTQHRVETSIQEVNMIERFSSIVQSGKLETRFVDNAINTMHICDALCKSAQRGEIVKPSRSTS